MNCRLDAHGRGVRAPRHPAPPTAGLVALAALPRRFRLRLRPPLRAGSARRERPRRAARHRHGLDLGARERGGLPADSGQDGSCLPANGEQPGGGLPSRPLRSGRALGGGEGAARVRAAGCRPTRCPVGPAAGDAPAGVPAALRDLLRGAPQPHRRGRLGDRSGRGTCADRQGRERSGRARRRARPGPRHPPGPRSPPEARDQGRERKRLGTPGVDLRRLPGGAR